MRTSRILSLAALAAFTTGIAATTAHAQATIDGTAEAFYGAARATQANATGFGDATTTTVANANGSELDQAFARVQGGTLYLTLAGNVESNFNKLELFFDTTTGGQNVLRADNVNVSGNGLNRMAGLTFDTGFNADYYLSFTTGNNAYFLDYATLPTNGGGTGDYIGTGVPGQTGGALTGGNLTTTGILANLNNSNILGVTGTGGTGAGVTTGVEFAIPLSSIGLPAGAFNISAFINGSGHDFLSNQVLGSLPATTANLGDPVGVNFANQAGTQSFSVPAAVAVPEPSALALLAPGFAGLGLIAARRRRNAA